METRSQHIRVSPTTKAQLENYREARYEAHVPLGQAVADLLNEVNE
jgi:hypothetical protein